MTEIFLGAAVFTGMVMALALIVLGARSLIWGRGRAILTVNGARTIESALGVKLLDALNHGGIRPPTSCGGVGTCGLCRVKVSGASIDDALPLECLQITPHDIAEGYRLACQVVVRSDLDIAVSPSLLEAQTWLCTVLTTRSLSPLIREIVLKLPADDRVAFAAGCYVLVSAPPFALPFSDVVVPSEHEEMWRKMGLRSLKIESALEQTRAYSLANRPNDQDRIILNIRLALPPGSKPDAPPGTVSSYLFSLRSGDAVKISGPYGSFFVKDTNQEIIFIGGGVGMAPLYANVYDQLERLQTKRTIHYWYGARSMMDLYYTDHMEALAQEHDNFFWHPVLSDPAPDTSWKGETGFVHEAAYRQYLSTHPAPQTCEYYLCGPPLMVQAVRAMLDRLGVPEDNIISDDFGAKP